MTYLEPLAVVAIGGTWVLVAVSTLTMVAVLSPHPWQRKAAREMLVFLLRRKI